MLDLLVEIVRRLEIVARLGGRSGMTIPHNLFPLAPFALLFLFFGLARCFVHLVPKQIGTCGCEIAERGCNVGALVEGEMLVLARFELPLLFFPSRIEELDSDVLGEFVLGNGLTTVGTLGRVDGDRPVDTYPSD